MGSRGAKIVGKLTTMIVVDVVERLLHNGDGSAIGIFLYAFRRVDAVAQRGEFRRWKLPTLPSVATPVNIPMI